MRTSRTLLNIECTAFTFRLQNASCVNGLITDIARRQFVPTNCPLLPSFNYRGD
ncbi:hypothetical protein [Hoylesella saccharolytica]|uniref:hypothetical protein n=1 Tax=Hoylesella saccharolytica TaxID=633701 RepID=UPI000A84E9E6|nr:hypothetical protein [Hoylesella saccharolytica]